MTVSTLDDEQNGRKAEIEAHYRHAETRMMGIFAMMIMLAAFFQWLVAQLPDLSSEALEVVCRILYP